VPIEFSQFKVRQGVLELRYSPAYLLWDRAGTIWRELYKRYPELKANVVQPNHQVMKVDNSSDAVLQVNTCSVTTTYPSTGLENFKLLVARFFQVVIATLEIETLERIGFRVIFERRFPTREETADFATNLTKYHSEKSKYLGIDGRVMDLDYAIRLGRRSAWMHGKDSDGSVEAGRRNPSRLRGRKFSSCRKYSCKY